MRFRGGYTGVFGVRPATATDNQLEDTHTNILGTLYGYFWATARDSERQSDRGTHTDILRRLCVDFRATARDSY